MALSEQSKERLGVVFEVVKTAFHWGFIPAVLYLGKLKIYFAVRSLFNFSPVLQASAKDPNLACPH